MSTKPTNIRIDARTDKKLDEAVSISGLPKADIIRQALAIGLKGLESIGFDMDSAIYEKIAAAKESANKATPMIVPVPGSGSRRSDKAK